MAPTAMAAIKYLLNILLLEVEKEGYLQEGYVSCVNE